MVVNSAQKDRNNLLKNLQGAVIDFGERYTILREMENGFVISTGMRFYDRKPVIILVSGIGANMCVVSDNGLTKSRIGHSEIPAQALAIRDDIISRYKDVHESDGELYVPSSFKLLHAALPMLTSAMLTVDAASIAARHIMPEYATVHSLETVAV